MKQVIKLNLGDMVATVYSLKYYPENINVGIVINIHPARLVLEDYYDYVTIQWNSGIQTTEKTTKLKVLSECK